ncbi:MAG: hypothetical protein PUB37_02275 [Firmicutes bacterium]|nr:hypothetical protein [Bacillota bacterium]
MSYCSNCGARISDDGVCPNCGSLSETKLRQTQKKVTEVFVCFKSFFSSRPLLAVENAARTKSAFVWVTFGAVYLAAAVASMLRLFTSIDVNIFATMADEKMVSIITAANGEISGEMLSAFLTLFGYSILMAVFSMLLIACATMLIFLMAEEKPSFSQALNITTVAAFPTALGMIATFICSFFSVPLAILMLTVGMMASAVSYYFGMQKASSFKKSPFWACFGAFILCGVLMGLFTVILNKLLV